MQASRTDQALLVAEGVGKVSDYIAVPRYVDSPRYQITCAQYARVALGIIRMELNGPEYDPLSLCNGYAPHACTRFAMDRLHNCVDIPPSSISVGAGMVLLEPDISKRTLELFARATISDALCSWINSTLSTLASRHALNRTGRAVTRWFPDCRRWPGPGGDDYAGVDENWPTDKRL